MNSSVPLSVLLDPQNSLRDDEGWFSYQRSIITRVSECRMSFNTSLQRNNKCPCFQDVLVPSLQVYSKEAFLLNVAEVAAPQDEGAVTFKRVASL
ncbi:Hypothetical predicted protein [Podarcis lilfordi]|uniref:Uncharacterized protein n=1 Tax=Podarcis lilfordi TaxID=74358 RepID=A0AA35K0M8_9SAUR|nr:Hypothetical predicted protein [Podarcis lilfordi]